ncbi:hypothetical protein [Lysinibacillus sp. C5.1]|uniref:hypothetical protein n=1 Tax=Lysinibacillus sp. C5.1 TaxID=2796169 RepID=UPI0030814554
MLNHYTGSKNSAISILKSKKFRMSRTDIVKTDDNEINHYLDIINKINEISEILIKLDEAENTFMFSRVLKIKEQRDKLIKDAFRTLFRCITTKFYYDNSLAIGKLASEILRTESYMACFTEESSSAHHLGIYGDVCFSFADNDVFEKINGFEIFSNEIRYLDTENFSELGNTAELFIDLLKTQERGLFDDTKFIDQFYEKLLSINYSQEEYFKKIIFILNEFNSIKLKNKDEFNLHNQLFTTSKVFIALKDSINVCNYLDEHTRSIRQNRFKDYLKDGGLVEYYMGIRNPFTHHINLASCFIKDIKFKDDKEYRFIALPTKYNQNQNYIEVPINTRNLRKITINPDLENRENAVSEIEEVLKNFGYKDVEVI